jgi:hypothetical protein
MESRCELLELLKDPSERQNAANRRERDDEREGSDHRRHILRYFKFFLPVAFTQLEICSFKYGQRYHPSTRTH